MVIARGAIDGAGVVIQSISSVEGGTVGATLTLNTTIGSSGVVNVGGQIGGDAKICQSIGSIGDNCKDNPL